MSLSTNDRDYELEKETIEFKSEDVGQEEGMLEEIEKYLDESDDIANATPDSLTSPGDVLNNVDHEWQEDCAEEARVQEDDDPTDDNKEHADEASEKTNFDFAHVEDDESSGGTEPESVVGESSSEDFADYYSDIPLPDDSDAPPECQKRTTYDKSSGKSESEPIAIEQGSSKCLSDSSNSSALPDNSITSSDKASSTQTEKEKKEELPQTFWTDAGIRGDYYGKWSQDYTTKEYKFKPLGRAIWLNDVIKNITDGTFSYKVSFKTEDDVCKQTISKSDAMNVRTIQTLCQYGADIPQKHVDIVIDTLRWQEEWNFTQKQRCSFVHTDLGWHDPKNSNEPMFKATTSIGGKLPRNSKYVGNVNISQGGTYEGWKKMVEDHVLGHAALETILIAALSSVVVGLIGEDTTRENPILHFADSSSSGKTTSAMLAASVGGRPFQGSERNRDTGKLQSSLYQSWYGTVNAIIGLQKGNMGFPIILDELSKIGGNTDLTSLIYNFSDGTDKSRMSKERDIVKVDPFRTSILSFGEISLLDKCKEKNDGLRLRVFEISGKLTEDAEHSRMLKKLCGENYGFALEKMARYILAKGGKKYVLSGYDKAIKTFSDSLPVFPGVDRFFEKFYAVYLTTVIIAKKALGIKFHLKKIFNFLNENLEKKIEKGNSAEGAYERLLEKFRANAHHINIKGCDTDKKVECWGAYNEVSYVADNGQKVIGEYSIRKNIFAEQLRLLGFVNKETIIKGFKKLGCLNYENGRDTRRRKIGSDTAELCYVIRVFEVEVSEDDVHEEIKPALQVIKTQFGTCYTSSSKRTVDPISGTSVKTLLS